MTSRNNSLRGSLLLLLTAFIWGIAFVAQSVGMTYVGPLTFVAVRNLLSAAVILALLPFLDKVRKVPEKKGLAGHFKDKNLLVGGLLCGLFLAVASTFQQTGILYTSVGKAGFITALYILLVPIAGIFLGRRLRPLILAGVALAVIGLYLLCMTDSLTLNIGDLLLLLCAFFFTFQIMLVDRYSPIVDGVRLSLIQFVVCAVFCGIPALIFEHPDLAAILAAWQPILYAGVLSGAVGYTLQIIAQKNTDPVIASLLMSLESVFSVLAGWVLLGQRLSARELAGCALMFTAIILAQLPERKAKKEG